MQYTEYTVSDYNNHHCEFTFNDGSTVTGVVAPFFFLHPKSYYLVTTDKMMEFQPHMDKQDEEEMRAIAQPIDLADIKSAKRLTLIS